VLRWGGWGGGALYGRLLQSKPVLGLFEGYRPIQFAMVSSVLLVAGAERLPAWLRAVLADAQNDLATRPLGEAVVLWTVLTLVAVVVGGLLVVFGVLVIVDPLLPGSFEAPERANLVGLWNVTLAIVAGGAELADLFSEAAYDPEPWRWWMNLLFSVGIARSVLVVTMLMASDWLGVPLDAALAPRALAVRIGPALTVAALLATIGAFVWAEAHLGFAAAAALVAVLSLPAAMVLELGSARR
jgi:hypothetical protein